MLPGYMLGGDGELLVKAQMRKLSHDTGLWGLLFPVVGSEVDGLSLGSLLTLEVDGPGSLMSYIAGPDLGNSVNWWQALVFPG